MYLHSTEKISDLSQYKRINIIYFHDIGIVLKVVNSIKYFFKNELIMIKQRYFY